MNVPPGLSIYRRPWLAGRVAFAHELIGIIGETLRCPHDVEWFGSGQRRGRLDLGDNASVVWVRRRASAAATFRLRAGHNPAATPHRLCPAARRSWRNPGPVSAPRNQIEDLVAWLDPGERDQRARLAARVGGVALSLAGRRVRHRARLRELLRRLGGLSAGGHQQRSARDDSQDVSCATSTARSCRRRPPCARGFRRTLGRFGHPLRDEPRQFSSLSDPRRGSPGRGRSPIGEGLSWAVLLDPSTTTLRSTRGPCDHCLDHDPVALAADDVGDQSAVDLEHVERQLGQISEAR